MKKWLFYLIVLVGLVVFLPAERAAAGGWVTVTFDELPETIYAGETVDLEFLVQQHGTKPINLDTPSPKVLLHLNEQSDEEIGAEGEGGQIFTAFQSGDKGRYAVAVQFPTAGKWAVTVDPNPFPIVETGIVDVSLAHADAASDAKSLPLPLLASLFGIASVMIAVLYREVQGRQTTEAA